MINETETTNSPSKESPSSLINKEVLDDLCDVLSPEVCKLQFGKFQTETSDYIIEFKELFESLNFLELQKKAHKSAGLCGLFGASEMMHNLYALEVESKAQNQEAINLLIEKVNNTWESTQKLMVQYF